MFHRLTRKGLAITYVALVLASLLLFSTLTLTTKAQEQPNSKSLDALLSLLKEADALTKDESVRSQLKQASEAVLRVLKADEGSKEVAAEMETVRGLLRHIADGPRDAQGAAFQEKIASALKVAQDNYSPSDQVAKLPANGTTEVVGPGKIPLSAATPPQTDVSTIIQEVLRRNAEGSAPSVQGQSATTIRPLARRAIAIAAGADHTCAIVSRGEVRCWGKNEYGQLGNGTTTDSSMPVAVTGLSGATAITAGGGHTCAIISGGEIRCWGQNLAGQLGNGSMTDSSIPTTVGRLSGATAIAAGQWHTCAIISGGEVRCWGSNGFVQLGWGVLGSFSTPVPVTYLSDAPVTVSETSPFFRDGFTRSVLSGATAIATGANHTCALLSGGEVSCWGANDSGQLGNGMITRAWIPAAAYGLSGATAIAAGGVYTCAIVSLGAVRCWGNNESGQLGNGSTPNHYVPVGVPGLSGVTAISAGRAHTCAIVSGGEIRCWGKNEKRQLGTNWGLGDQSYYVPVAVFRLSGATAIATGANHTCALLSGGEVRCWGNNENGQLGNGTTTSSWRPITVGT